MRNGSGKGEVEKGRGKRSGRGGKKWLGRGKEKGVTGEEEQ